MRAANALRPTTSHVADERLRFADTAERIGLGFLDESNYAQGLLAVVIDPI